MVQNSYDLYIYLIKTMDDRKPFFALNRHPIVIITAPQHIVSDKLERYKVTQPLYPYFEMVVQT